MTASCPETGSLIDRQTAERSAAQQVIPTLSFRTASARGQKSVCFCLCCGVHVPSENLTNSIGVGSKFLNDIRVRYALKAHHMSGNRVDERQSGSLFCDNVQFNTRNWVSFVRGIVPEQVGHGFPFPMAGETLGEGRRAPAVSYGRTFYEGAVASIGVGGVNPRPDSSIKLHMRRQIKADICGRVKITANSIFSFMGIAFLNSLKMLDYVSFPARECERHNFWCRVTIISFREAFVPVRLPFRESGLPIFNRATHAACGVTS